MELMSLHGGIRKARWYAIPVRVVIMTLVVTLISFAVSLLLGLIGVLLVAKIRALPPDLTLAYRNIALPVATVVGTIVLALSLVMEIRHYRQTKALAEIEKAG
jgi:hypothetical protein